MQKTIHRAPQGLQTTAALEVSAALEGLVELVASRIAEKLKEERQGEARYFDQDTAPIARRTYLRAARDRAFPSSRVGKRVLALRSDVHAWIAQRQRPAGATPAPEGAPSVLARVAAASGYELLPEAPAASRRRAPRVG